MGDSQRVVSDALTLAGAGGRATSLSEAVKDAILPVAPGFTDSVATIARQLEQLRGLAQQQAEAVAENTQVVAQNTAAQNGGGATSIAGSVASSAAKMLGGGLSLLPLVSSLAGLFSGGKSEAPPALPTYTAPPAVQFLGSAPQQGGHPIAAVDYGQDGRPRASSATPASTRLR
ncbi:MAG: hypothetical protein EHM65_11610 [Acidobacteriales bacterium]|nr:MAG: hypothetical protein EHM65_11610 [Terriglobales bacterium]